MAYTKRIVCFANSYKTGGSCIAGKDVETGEWIRPVSDRSTQELIPSEYCYAGYKIPALLDIMDVSLGKSVPHSHQTENHLIINEQWVKRGKLSWDDLEQFRDQPTALWANTTSTKGGGIYDCMSAEIADKYDYSLSLIQQNTLTIEVGSSSWDGRTKKTYRGRFKFKGVTYNFGITDPVARASFKNRDEGEYELNDVYLCLSLTEPFEKDGRCYKLIAGVCTNPPL